MEGFSFPGWGPSKGDPETRTWVQVASSVGSTKQHESVGGKGKTGRREKSIWGSTDGNWESSLYVSSLTMRCPDMWSNIILAVSVRAFLDEVNI